MRQATISNESRHIDGSDSNHGPSTEFAPVRPMPDREDECGHDKQMSENSGERFHGESLLGPAPMIKPSPCVVDLRDLGWDEQRIQDWTTTARQSLIPGRISSEGKHAYRVVCEQGELEGILPGKLNRGDPSEMPKVGDWVAVERMPGEAKLRIDSVLPRRSKVVRKDAGKTIEEQVLAANIDVVFAVQPLDDRFNLRLLERHLVMAREGGARPVVVLNKADLSPDPNAALQAAQNVSPGIEVHLVSAKTRLGIPRLRETIANGTTAVFLGASGVGKSSLVNKLYGERVQHTAAVRESDLKGRHTTTSRELILLPGGGLVIDTPGLREFHLWTTTEGLSLAFPDIVELAQGCRFRDCEHRTETPCAVKDAVARGELDPARHASYLKLRAESNAVQRDRRPPKSRSGRRPRLPENESSDE